MTCRRSIAGTAFALWFAVAGACGEPPADGARTKRVAVEFTGGHDTDERDRGRPVKLIAAGLGVPEQVFRDAFKNVRPAPAGERPDPEQVRRNKRALMDALAKYGVTSERLDEVSNYYRYRPGRDELWKNKPAAAFALVKDGTVVGFDVTDGGAGYTTPPTARVPGFENAAAVVELAFGEDLDRNGRIEKIALVKRDAGGGAP